MNKIKISIPIIICIGLIITMGIFFDRVNGQANTPGTVGDPLVTKSYVDQANSNLLSQVQQIIENNEQEAQPAVTTNMTEIYQYIDEHLAVASVQGVQVSDGFKVVEVEAGQSLIGEEGTEIILRHGNAVAIANAAGEGLSDVTIGKAITGGKNIEIDHLLIVPRADGRGLSVSQKSYIMVKGNYIIQ